MKNIVRTEREISVGFSKVARLSEPIASDRPLSVRKTETSPSCPCALIAGKVLQEVEVLPGEPQTFELVLKKKSARNRDQLLELDSDAEVDP